MTRLLSQQKQARILNFIEEVSENMNESTEFAERYVTPFNIKRMNFYQRLAKYVGDNYKEIIHTIPDYADELEEVYRAVKHPHKFHFELIGSENYSFGEKLDMLKLMGNKDKYSLYVSLSQLSKDKYPINPDVIKYMLYLDDKDVKKLTKNFDQYQSYIIINHNRESFIPSLLKGLESDTLAASSIKLDKYADIASGKYKSSVLKNQSDEFLLENYNPIGFELLKNHSDKLRLIEHNQLIQYASEDEDFLAYILRTTTEENFDLRKHFATNVFNANNYSSQKDEVLAFFKKLDEDDAFKALYKKVIESDSPIQKYSIKDLLYYTEVFGSDTLLRKSDNFLKILEYNSNRLSDKEEIVDRIKKNLNNKYYTTPYSLTKAKQAEYSVKYFETFGHLKAGIMRFRRKFKTDVLAAWQGRVKETPMRSNISYSEFDPSKCINAQNV